MVKVVNRHHEKYDVYIGRGTPAGNPFIVGIDGDNQMCIDKYRIYFNWRMGWDSIFRNYIHNLDGKVVGCSCKPKPCHGDIIVEYFRNG